MRMCSTLKRHWRNSIIISIKMHSANDSKFGLLFPFSFGNPNIFWWVSSPTWLFIWHLARHYFVPWLNLISIISIENKQAQVSTQDNKIRSLNETTHGYRAQEVLQFRPKLVSSTGFLFNIVSKSEIVFRFPSPLLSSAFIISSVRSKVVLIICTIIFVCDCCHAT